MSSISLKLHNGLSVTLATVAKTGPSSCRASAACNKLLHKATASVNLIRRTAKWFRMREKQSKEAYMVKSLQVDSIQMALAITKVHSDYKTKLTTTITRTVVSAIMRQNILTKMLHRPVHLFTVRCKIKWLTLRSILAQQMIGWTY